MEDWTDGRLLHSHLLQSTETFKKLVGASRVLLVYFYIYSDMKLKLGKLITYIAEIIHPWRPNSRLFP